MVVGSRHGFDGCVPAAGARGARARRTVRRDVARHRGGRARARSPVESFVGCGAPCRGSTSRSTVRIRSTPNGWLVKGGGAAHTREKAVAAAADRFVVIVSSDKLVERARPARPARAARVRPRRDDEAARRGGAPRRAAQPGRRCDRRLHGGVRRSARARRAARLPSPESSSTASSRPRSSRTSSSERAQESSTPRAEARHFYGRYAWSRARAVSPDTRIQNPLAGPQSPGRFSGLRPFTIWVNSETGTTVERGPVPGLVSTVTCARAGTRYVKRR